LISHIIIKESDKGVIRSCKMALATLNADPSHIVSIFCRHNNIQDLKRKPQNLKIFQDEDQITELESMSTMDLLKILKDSNIERRRRATWLIGNKGNNNIDDR